MRALVVAVVLTLALGFTVKDMTGGSGASPTQAWENRVETVDQSTNLSQTGADLHEWIIEKLREAQAANK